MKNINSSEKRIHYLGPLAKIILHIISGAACIFFIGWSIVDGSWVPVSIYLVVLAIAEAFFWYDTYRGWPQKK
jgi:uncharacterized membrane protein